MRDSAGRTVVLTEERWEHILDGHPIVDGHDLALETTVERCDVVCDGSRGAVRIYGRNLGPSRWFVVVVAYASDGTGKVLTAYPSKKDPPEPRSVT